MEEENKNMFEGAKFGDKFITRDGREALYLNEGLDTESNNCHILQIKKVAYYSFYTNEGKDTNYILTDNNCPSDIISRYQEEIDEESLNDIVSEYAINADVEAHSMIVNQGMSESTARFNVVCKAYIAGYRQRAKEER